MTRGRTTATLPAALFAAHEGDDVEVMRGELGRILHESTREHVEYLFGDEIIALDQTTEGVRVTFRHADPRTFDLVVGADGLHFRVRALTFGPEDAHLRHLGCHLAVFSVPNHLGLDRSERMHVTPGRTTNVYSTWGMSDARALFLFPSPPADQLPDRHDTAGQRRLLAELFAGRRWEVPRLLAALPSTSDFYFDSISQVHLDRWSSGRVALLGDAGYSPSPATGQGTSLALVGAYVLAGELAAAGGDHVAAFAGYERRLREFVRRNQDLGPKLVRTMVARSRLQVWLTTRMMAALPHLPGRHRLVSRVVRPVQDAAHAVELPDYVTSPGVHRP
jgi:2-polyprenyl-6-methoxyphenol hydroxylase-like FAD-dependent oxidoreductase